MKPTPTNDLRATHPFLGTWLSVGSPVIAELAAESGFDWLLFDLEHGCGPEATLLGNLQAIKGTRAVGIVRVGAPHPDLIMRVLDWGAAGIMVPHVASAADVDTCTLAVHYLPRGRRGMSRTVRAYNYGLNPPGARLPAPVLIAQIETLEGVRNVEAIAQKPAVDCLFVGPADLSFDLSHQRNIRGFSYAECLKRVCAAARANHKPAGILVRDVDELPALRRLGFTHLAIDSDLGILRKRYQQLVGQKPRTRPPTGVNA